MTNDMHGIDCRPTRTAGSSRVHASFLAAFMLLLLTINLQPLAAQPVQVCRGTLSASPLRPVSKPWVVELDHPINSVANPGLAKAFLDGVQNAGATVVSKGQGTTNLDLSFLMRVTEGEERDLQESELDEQPAGAGTYTVGIERFSCRRDGLRSRSIQSFPYLDWYNLVHHPDRRRNCASGRPRRNRRSFSRPNSAESNALTAKCVIPEAVIPLRSDGCLRERRGNRPGCRVEIALSLLINPLVGLPPLVSRGVPSLGSTARSDGAR